MSSYGDTYTWLDEVLILHEQQLIDRLDMQEPIVCVTLSDDPIVAPPANQYVTLYAGAQRVMQSAVSGGGNTAFIFDGRLNVILWNRFNIDRTGKALKHLTADSRGSLAKVKAIITALQLFNPVDDADNYILAQPTRLADEGFRPVRPRTKAEGSLSWRGIEIPFEISYRVEVT